MPASHALGALGVSTLVGLGDTPPVLLPGKTLDTIVVLPGIPPLKRSVVEHILSGGLFGL